MDTRYGPNMSQFDLETLRMNKFFLMTKGGHGMSLDEVNELLNSWFKKFLKSPSLQTNVENSKHVMTLRKCAYESFGYKEHKTGSRLEATQRNNVNKIVGLLKRVNVYPKEAVSRDFDKDFFWQHVDRPKSVGTKADKAKETVTIVLGKKRLHSVLCQAEDVREDLGLGEFEMEKDDEDNECTSIMSSRAGSIANDAEFRNHGLNMDSDDDDNDKDEMTEEALVSGLKLLGNVKRRKMSPLIHKDLLGVDGQVAMVGTKKTYSKELAREQSKLYMMRIWNGHFDRKMDKRMKQLKLRQNESKLGTYKCHKFNWREVYSEVMIEKRDTVMEKK